MSAAIWAPYTFTAYLTPLVTFVMVYAYYIRKDRISDDEDAEQVYGKELSDNELPEVNDLA